MSIRYRITEAVARVDARLTLFQKLALRFVAAAVVPMLIMAWLFLRQANVIIVSQTIDSDARALSQTASLLDNDMELNKKALGTFSSLPKVREIMAEDPKGMTIFEQSLSLRELSNYLTLINTTDSVFRSVMYVRDELFFAREGVTVFPLSRAKAEGWYAAAESAPFAYSYAPGRRYVYNHTLDVISVAACVRHPSVGIDVIGAVSLEIDAASYSRMLAESLRGEANALCVITPEGELVASGRAAGAGDPFADETFAERALKAIGGRETVSSEPFGGEWLLSSAYLAETGWLLVELAPAAVMNIGTNALFLQITGIVAALAAVVIIVSLRFSRDYASRVTNIASAIQRYSDGDAEARLTVTSSDVIGELSHNVNRLFERMNLLMAERFRLGEQAKRADLNVLQAQINPHFLYNTLDMVYWMAVNGETGELPEVVLALAGFYRKALARGRDVVPVADELEHIRCYVAIQRRRFQDSFSVKWDIDETLLEAHMLKLLLQPLVENAIQHGIGDAPDRSGTVVIRLSREGADMRFTVSDDGAGMSRERMESILTRDEGESSAEKGHSYGVYNVNMRIRLFYGDDCGLVYTGAPGKGTTVTLRLPLR